MTTNLHPQAELEFASATRFYEEKVAGLGLEFVADVERGVVLITANPDIGQRLDAQVRRVILARFPYNLIYRTNESGVNILAVAHQSRRPGFWRS